MSRLSEIQARDESYGPNPPKHWVMVQDRRFLLAEVQKLRELLIKISERNKILK